MPKLIFVQKNLLTCIKEYELDGILNAANGIGVMGAGIAGAIRTAGGYEIQRDAMQVCKNFDPKEGEAYVTISGSLEGHGIKNIIHAVVMKQPGGKTSYEIIDKAFTSALIKAKECGIKKLGCTALGTGVGRLNPEKVAEHMYTVAMEQDIDIVFADFSSTFIKSLNKCDEFFLGVKNANVQEDEIPI